MNKCCGTCKWCYQIVPIAKVGTCGYWDRIPSIYVTDTRVSTFDGQDCPLYEAKDGENNGTA